ncbi:VCBS repeat-containing protein [Kitasatospora sp. MMS16-BH015]|uniref:FG-GAP repeat domain-containing protein n=1 Tax=Kitasatospora sp. MMS16-BH015 TaxID=2018025 RepID=UPI000CF2DCC0|nr:VCBS repeat-containing protein [Kitasatospora sp. MMS16-BH015]
MATQAAHADTNRPADRSAVNVAAATDAAVAKARNSGKPVDIPEATDAYKTVAALPDGRLTATMSATPQRASKNGKWVPIDTTLRKNQDGTFSSAATVNPLSISGGGKGPLYTLNNGGRHLSVSWPTALPTPEVSGGSATYREVLPGTDLKLVAGPEGGVSELLVVKTPEAARNPALSELSLKLDTSPGLTATTDPANGPQIVGPDGTPVFRSPAATMWSAGQTAPAASPSLAARQAPAEAPAASDAPLPTAKVGKVATTLDGHGHIKLTPDQRLLTDPTVKFPLTIDPPWVPWSANSNAWTIIDSAFPDQNYLNGNMNPEDPGVGYQGWQAPFSKREALYQFSVGWLGSSHVYRAALNTTQTTSADSSCTQYPISVDSTKVINTGTTWHNDPAVLAHQDSQPVGGTGCGAGTVSFNVLQAVQNDGGAGDDQAGTVTFLLSGDESDTARNGWKRFAKTASLTVTYNRVPNAPTSTVVSPAPVNGNAADPQGCNQNGGYGWYGKIVGNLTFSAKVSDPDGGAQNVSAQFGVNDNTTGRDVVTLGSSGSTGNSVSGGGGTSSIAVPGSSFTDGHLYSWRAKTTDTIDVSAQSPNCHFYLDTTAPNSPTASTPNGIQTVGKPTTIRLTGAGDPAPTGGAASGVSYFIYTTSGDASDLTGGRGTKLAPGNSDFTIQGNTWGANTVWFAAVDRAGNMSAPASFTVNVPDDLSSNVYPGDINGLSDANGLKHPDMLAVDNNGGLRLYDITQDSSASGYAASNIDSPNGVDWSNTYLAHRGSYSGNRFDDLFAMHKGAGQLYLYVNQSTQGAFNPATDKYFATANTGRLPVLRPTCDAGDCTGYSDTWASVTQLLVPGDLTGDGIPDLLTYETYNGVRALWLYPGNFGGGALGSPQKVATTLSGGTAAALNDGMLMAPGDVSNDGIPDLWFRSKASGAIYQFTTARNGSTITFTNDTRIGELDPTSSPLVTSLGDINGTTPSFADLFATNTDGKLYFWLGQQPTASDYHAFGNSIVRGLSGWNSIVNIEGNMVS